jgi:hypothetical protein
MHILVGIFLSKKKHPLRRLRIKETKKKETMLKGEEKDHDRKNAGNVLVK